MTPAERFQKETLRTDFIVDAAQQKAVDQLQELFDTLLISGRERGLWQKLSESLRGGRISREPIRGLYLWGPVGRGKTFLMDLFYECLPFEDKLRSHFHRFMHGIHAQLKHTENKSEPLQYVADKLAARTRIICFDEFFVSDIADAMILGRLFEILFGRGVCLVATSNVAPDELYKDGLQRQRFLPAIELIKRHTRVVSVSGHTDYRLRELQKAEIYHSPLDEEADENLERYFNRIAPELGSIGFALEVEGRTIYTRRHADGVVWFDFYDICDGPRSQNDYIEIARCYQTVLVSNIPVLDEELEDQSRRFIALVDEFYDRNVKLIVSAAAPLETLYRGRRLSFEFRRTRSRLQEMQSKDYLARPHLP